MTLYKIECKNNKVIQEIVIIIKNNTKLNEFKKFVKNKRFKCIVNNHIDWEKFNMIPCAKPGKNTKEIIMVNPEQIQKNHNLKKLKYIKIINIVNESKKNHSIEIIE